MLAFHWRITESNIKIIWRKQVGKRENSIRSMLRYGRPIKNELRIDNLVTSNRRNECRNKASRKYVRTVYIILFLSPKYASSTCSKEAKLNLFCTEKGWWNWWEFSWIFEPTSSTHKISKVGRGDLYVWIEKNNNLAIK